MTKSKPPEAGTRTLTNRELANVTGGAMSDILSTGTELRSSKEWNDDWLAPKLTTGIGGMIG